MRRFAERAAHQQRRWRFFVELQLVVLVVLLVVVQLVLVIELVVVEFFVLLELLVRIVLFVVAIVVELGQFELADAESRRPDGLTTLAEGLGRGPTTESA